MRGREEIIKTTVGWETENQWNKRLLLGEDQ